MGLGCRALRGRLSPAFPRYVLGSGGRCGPYTPTAEPEALAKKLDEAYRDLLDQGFGASKSLPWPGSLLTSSRSPWRTGYRMRCTAVGCVATSGMI